MLTVGKDGSVIEKLKEILEKYLEGASPKYYPPVENLLDLIYVERDKQVLQYMRKYPEIRKIVEEQIGEPITAIWKDAEV